ncbi:MAG: hypothetical protein QOG97_3137 [Acidimicrobiaceae bacterium]|nr:hypothetical protein [Acidimicrobiaceae bacterium]
MAAARRCRYRLVPESRHHAGVATTAEIVEAYWIFHRLSTGTRPERLRSEDYFWAWEEINHVLEDGTPHEGLNLLDALLHAPETDPGTIGAGCLEDLLYSRPAEVGDQVATRARRDERWRQALDHVYVPDEVLPLLPDELRLYLAPR